MSKKSFALIITIIIITLIIGAGIIVYQSSKTRNKTITTLSHNSSTTLPTPSVTLPTPPNDWKLFGDAQLGLEFKIPSGVIIGEYEPLTNSYSDYYSAIQNMVKDKVLTLPSKTGITVKDNAEYYYNLYQTGGTNLKIYYNNTGGKSDKFSNKLLVIFNNPSQLPFNQWKNFFEYCDAYNPAISMFESDVCPEPMCICNYGGKTENNIIPEKYEIFEQIPTGNNLTVYLGNNGYNFAGFLPYKDKVYIVSKTYQTTVKSPSLSIEEAKNDFLNSTELKILSSLKFTN